MTFLMTEHGASFSAAGFGNWFRRVCDAAGLSGCSAHGLRHAAGRRLAEAGCTEHEIAATLGMSLRMVARYTASTSQEHLADQALSRRLRAEREQNLPNHRNPRLPSSEKAMTVQWDILRVATPAGLWGPHRLTINSRATSVTGIRWLLLGHNCRAGDPTI